MNLITKSIVRDTSKFLLDVCKVTTTTTFIVPYISGITVEPNTFQVMLWLSVALYILSMFLNRLSDRMEGDK